MKEIIITHPDKIISSKGKVTKLDVAGYYNDIAPLLLKELKNRPITAYRCHGGECFFKKHPQNESEDVERILIENDEYFYIKNSRQLLSQVQLGTIEFHTWGCKAGDIDHPDQMIFDLDPAEDVPISRLRKGVLNLKEVIDQLNLQSLIKTSGGKGYHIIVPLKKKLTWEEVGLLSYQISSLLEEKYPELYTTNIRKNRRKGKIFIDYLRNKKGASCVAAYSLRARDYCPISMPIEWEQLNDIKPNEVNIKNYKSFLKV